MTDKPDITAPASGAFQTRTVQTRDDWQTPEIFFKRLGAFDLDPCANHLDPNRIAERFFTEADNGLKQDWIGRVFCNPPYGKYCKDWMERCASHGNAIALIPPRVGSAWFQEKVLATADAVYFLKGRISFINAVSGKAVSGNNADSCFIAWGEGNTAALRDCGIAGKLWPISARAQAEAKS